MTDRVILLAEDNTDDKALTLRALKKHHMLGANAYVRKPVKFSAFTGGVSALGVFWLLLNEAAGDYNTPLDGAVHPG